MRVGTLPNIIDFKPKQKAQEAKPAFTGTGGGDVGSKISSDLMKVYFTGTKSLWSQADTEKRNQINTFAEDYKSFLDEAKTDMTAVTEIVKRAKTQGFKPWPEDVPDKPMKAGDKYYRINRDRSVSLVVIGDKPATEGFKLAGAHVDSPHIMLKPNALQESQGFAIFKTMVHGGIKAHQWTQRNLALIGKVITKDNRVVNINIGNKPGEPVLVIPELAPHVDRNRTQTLGDAFPKEKLNPIVGLNEADGLNEATQNKISKQIAAVLKQKYGIEADDLLNAQLALVPAANARDAGLDQSMISGYGSDDKSSSYCSMQALFDAAKEGNPDKTIISTHFSNEEIGSYNNYGAQSDDTRAIISELIEYSLPKGQKYNENLVRQAFKNSVLVSADVSTALDPMRPDAEEPTNAARLGHGPSIYKNGPLFSTPEASADFMRTQKGVQLQPFAFNQDKGGGGTIGNYLATQNNTDVVDTGIPVIGMHAPVELISKADLYEHYLSLKNYYKN
jgi:aspartyl aminopeptidase